MGMEECLKEILDSFNGCQDKIKQQQDTIEAQQQEIEILKVRLDAEGRKVSSWQETCLFFEKSIKVKSELIDKLEKLIDANEEKHLQDMKDFDNQLTDVVDEVLMLTKDKVEIENKIKQIKVSINNKDLQIEQIKKDIILSKNMANRNGRPKVLTDEDIQYVKQLRAENLSLRKIAEMIDVSHTTISNALKADLQAVKKESNTESLSSENNGIGQSSTFNGHEEMSESRKILEQRHGKNYLSGSFND